MEAKRRKEEEARRKQEEIDRKMAVSNLIININQNYIQIIKYQRRSA